MAYEGKPGREFIDLEIVQTHLTVATEYVASSASQTYRENMDGILRYMHSVQFDSPLEVLFWVWWEACLAGGAKADMLYLSPQHEVLLPDGERYRVDFLVDADDRRVASRPDWTPVAVEVDGHGFHERTREQVAYRDRRDRALQKFGWKVFHFSFGEFTSRPVECIGEVIVYARNQFNRVSIAEYNERSKDAG